MRTGPFTLPAATALEARRLLAVSEAVIRALHARSLQRDLTAADVEQLAAMLTGEGAGQLIARLDTAERELHACLSAQETQ